jgi:hypothetical protein
MRILFTILLSCFYSISFPQSYSENDIKTLAQQINDKLKGTDIGNGITVRGCYAFERTLVYLYNVTDQWYPSRNMKEDLIANFKKGGISDLYFNNEINVDFQYYYENKLRTRITIKSNEFSNLNFSLGDYISLKGHPDAKGVDMKIKIPLGWKIAEGDRPNIIKTFAYKGNTYLIIIKDNATFFSRNEIRKTLTPDYIKEFISESSTYFKNAETVNYQIVTLDSYPTLEFTIKGNKEISGYDLKMIMKTWVIFYEDKIILLQCVGLDGKEFNTLEPLYNLITNSVIFPEQYNN